MMWVTPEPLSSLFLIQKQKHLFVCNSYQALSQHTCISWLLCVRYFSYLWGHKCKQETLSHPKGTCKFQHSTRCHSSRSREGRRKDRTSDKQRQNPRVQARVLGRCQAVVRSSRQSSPLLAASSLSSHWVAGPDLQCPLEMAFCSIFSPYAEFQAPAIMLNIRCQATFFKKFIFKSKPKKELSLRLLL